MSNTDNMNDFTRWLQSLYKRARSSTTEVPAYIAFENGQIENGEALDTAFAVGEHYFQVILNEMFLSQRRRWATEYYPVVFAGVEFLYDKAQQMLPKIIGPNLLENYKQPIREQGTRYINTPVTGLHPYNGGNLSVVLILYRAVQTNHLSDLLAVIEKVIDAVDPSVALSSYLTMANVVKDGLDLLIGTNQTEPLVAVRETINIALRGEFTPGYYALINAPEETIEVDKLWVRDGRLFQGNTLSSAVPFTNHDFILFSILQEEKRKDIRALPFFSLWEEAQRQATKTTTWNEAKLSFTALWRAILLSPDLTQTQKETLIPQFKQEMTNIRDRARDLDLLGTTTPRSDEKVRLSEEIVQFEDWLQGLD